MFHRVKKGRLRKWLGFRGGDTELCGCGHLPACCAGIGDPETDLLNGTSHQGVVLVHGGVYHQVHLWRQQCPKGWEGRGGAEGD